MCGGSEAYQSGKIRWTSSAETKLLMMNGAETRPVMRPLSGSAVSLAAKEISFPPRTGWVRMLRGGVLRREGDCNDHSPPSQVGHVCHDDLLQYLQSSISECLRVSCNAGLTSCQPHHSEVRPHRPIERDCILKQLTYVISPKAICDMSCAVAIIDCGISSAQGIAHPYQQ